MSTPVWVVEDDPACSFTITETLGDHYDVRQLGSLGELIAALEANRPRLLLADLNLPDGNFLDAGVPASEIPLIVISSMDTREAIARSFDAGAADFLTKPFSANELAAKVERLLAPHPPRTVTVAHENLKLDYSRASLTIDGKLVFLTQREFQILTCLVGGNGSPVGRANIVEYVWEGLRVGPKTFDVHLTNLRRKLREYGWLIQHTEPQSYQLRRVVRPLGN